MDEERYWRLRDLFVALVGIVVVFGCVVRAAPGAGVPFNPYSGLAVGSDVSWPNCQASPPEHAAWGVVGVTGGLALHENKCAGAEASWFKLLSLYANTGYPGSMRAVKYSNSPRYCMVNDLPCVAYDYGYAEGVYAVSLATHHGLHTTMWWLDVETSNSWDDNPVLNRASIQGTLDAIRHETVVARIGIYSYPAQWDLITAHWRPGFPAWVATGLGTEAAAKSACRQPSFTGGPMWLGQYTAGLDRNVVCSDA